MRSSRLLSRFREVLTSRGISLDAETSAFAVDFVRLAVRALRLVELVEVERHCLIGAIQVRTGLDTFSAGQLLDMAIAPEFRAAVSDFELRSFSARFGEKAASRLRGEAEEEIDLLSFGRTYGSSSALLLLDTLFSVAGADGTIRAEEVERLRRAADELGVDAVLVSALLQKHDPRHASGDLRIPLTTDQITIGRAPSCDLVLADPQVAHRHAELQRTSCGWRVKDMGSGRPTVVNGSPVSSAPLTHETRLRVGPYTLRLVGEELSVFGERSFSALSVRELSRVIDGVTLLEQVSFTVFSGEVIALVGPSGAGKTTLLNAISGVAPADSGEVLLDDQDFHRLLSIDRSLVGNVPQDDLVPPELTVEESLFYSGRLRFPADVTDREVMGEVDRVLVELDIQHIRSSRIGDALRRGISGGQRKRVNLGQELMTRSTRMLFLDEPTSGLDPRASQDIVRLVRQLADRGRIVFLVTHDLTPEVMAQVDHLLVLAKGGRVAYFGPPKEACQWFGVSTPDAIFNRFVDHTPEEWGQMYRDGDARRKYVTTREHLLGLKESSTTAEDIQKSVKVSQLRQLRTLTTRYLRTRLRDRTGMLVMGLQPPILIAVMAIVFPAPTVELLFMLSLSSLWFGMSSSVRELISDRVIWRRERRVGVGVLPYVFSKTLILASLTGLQAILLAGANYLILDMGAYGFHAGALIGVSVLTAWLGMTLGMLVSAVWTSSEAAVGTLPLILIPQITFSSILVAIRDMAPLAKGLTWVTFQRYTFDAALKCGDEVAVRNNRGEFTAEPINASLYKLGLKFTDAADDIGFTLNQLMIILAAGSVILLLATMLRVWSRREG
ncbi:MAG: ATP-binding cassette domain-containing protein [Myxococcota bacterium]|nr:ATP-binding cassette domain-containing protein [Myxococcota bacterium]